MPQSYSANTSSSLRFKACSGKAGGVGEIQILLYIRVAASNSNFSADSCGALERSWVHIILDHPYTMLDLVGEDLIPLVIS